jgi:hypothetical protein
VAMSVVTVLVLVIIFNSHTRAFIICNLLKDAGCNSEHVAWNDWVILNNRLERMPKATVVA